MALGGTLGAAWDAMPMPLCWHGMECPCGGMGWYAIGVAYAIPCRPKGMSVGRHGRAAWDGMSLGRHGIPRPWGALGWDALGVDWDGIPLGQHGTAWDATPLGRTGMECPLGGMGWDALGVDWDGIPLGRHGMAIGRQWSLMLAIDPLPPHTCRQVHATPMLWMANPYHQCCPPQSHAAHVLQIPCRFHPHFCRPKAFGPPVCIVCSLYHLS